MKKTFFLFMFLFLLCNGTKAQQFSRIMDAAIAWTSQSSQYDEQAIIEYELMKKEKITIELFDLTGRLVQHFIINEKQSAGVHKETLYIEGALPPGNYILRVGNGKIWQSVKLVKG